VWEKILLFHLFVKFTNAPGTLERLGLNAHIDDNIRCAICLSRKMDGHRWGQTAGWGIERILGLSVVMSGDVGIATSPEADLSASG